MKANRTPAKPSNIAETMKLDIRCDSAEGLLTLLAIRGIGPQAAERIAARFATLGDVRDASPRHLAEVVSDSVRSLLRDEHAWKSARVHALRILDQADEHSVRVLTAADGEYPVWLREIPDRPPVIYVKGKLPPGRRYIACIGTREPSRFGELATQRITAHLVENGWSIVSGLAIGIDTLAHQAALDAKGHTVAVLANGLETVYPKRNKALADRILGAGGAWLSEQPFGVAVLPRNLVRRDRLQSGMSAGTIVMQTDIEGGSMHTVRFTLLQKRRLFAPVPDGQHSEEPKSRGVLALTRKSGADLSELLGAQGEYRDLLQSLYRDKPPAVPLNSSEDYRDLLGQLNEMLLSPTEDARSQTGSQAGLF